jgi:hypothetical protein
MDNGEKEDKKEFHLMSLDETVIAGIEGKKILQNNIMLFIVRITRNRDSNDLPI